MDLPIFSKKYFSKYYFDQPQDLARILDELSTESRDISMRPFLERMAKHLLHLLEMDPTSFDDRRSFWLDPNATMIFESDPGRPIENGWKMFVGKKEIQEFFIKLDESIRRRFETTHLDFILVVADRGRITSLYKRHRKNKHGSDEEIDLILVIMDLNASNNIERLQYRYLEESDYAITDRWEKSSESMKKRGLITSEMGIPDHVMFSRRLAELTGESRDRNLQPFLEKQATKLIDDLFWGEAGLSSEWFDASISLVINLEQNPGMIFLGKDEAMEYFKNHDEKNDMEQKWYHWNIVLVTADRGRVTSYVEKLSVEFNENRAVGPINTEVILITMDLNDSNKIQRMEYRVLRRDKIANHMSWEEALAKLMTKSVVIDYNIEMQEQ
ncbi:hypothetical protein N0V92_004559 [Colletotrichum tropicale]|nr:hypothetical protein N0V92_004559 [Colletotrichum tropicale]